MKKTYVFDADFLGVTLEVDFDVMTPELAAQINNFWMNAEDVLAATEDNDIIEAVARRAASMFLQSACEGNSIQQAQEQLDSSEGWPPAGEHGIRLIDFEIPDLSASSLELMSVEEV